MVNMRFSLRPGQLRIYYLHGHNAPDFLVVAYIHVVLELLLGTQIPVHALFNQYRLYRSVPKYNTGGKEAVNHGEEDLDCEQLAIEFLNSFFHCIYIPIRRHFGTSYAPIVGSSPVASVHVPTGLKDILRSLELGLASLLHGSISSTAVRRCDNDIVRFSLFFYSRRL
jgi:hypothetical protein